MIFQMKRFYLALGIIAAGILLTAYPWISNHLYEKNSDSTIHVYEAQAEEYDETEKMEVLAKAYDYNERLADSNVRLTDPFSAKLENNDLDPLYHECLAFDDSGLMGYIEIPSIGVYLPVYHGTDDAALSRGVGHLEGSSLPVGGDGTHSVLSGHTGINNAKMFTDLENMELGDLFFIHILDDVYAYEVCDINVVEPSDASLLASQLGRDLCTLVTCTPYGVNSHRLLVTGERTGYTEEAYDDALADGPRGESQWMENYKKALAIGFTGTGAVILAYLLGCLISRHRKKRLGDSPEKGTADMLPRGLYTADAVREEGEK